MYKLKKISRENIQKNLPNPTYAFDSFWQGGAILVVACRSLGRRCLVITAVTTNTGLLRVFSVCLNLSFVDVNQLFPWFSMRSHHIVFLFQKVFICLNQLLIFGSTSLCIRLKNYLFLYACELTFCNLYVYDSEKKAFIR